MSFGVAHSEVAVAFAGAAPHGLSHGYMLAFPCSYERRNEPHSEHEEPLKSTGVSASNVSRAFESIGFKPSMHADLGAAYIVGTVAGAAQALRSSDVLVVYFCGHGFARGTTQFIIANDGKYFDVETFCTVVSQATSGKGLQNVTLLVLLDCCRDYTERTSTGNLRVGLDDIC